MTERVFRVFDPPPSPPPAPPARAEQVPAPAPAESNALRETRDVSEACASVGRMLESWNTRYAVFDRKWNRYQPLKLVEVEVERRFRDVAPDWHWELPPGAVGIVSGYALNERDRARSEPKPEPAEPDQRPYFRDPAVLAFDPRESMEKDDGREHDGIAFRSIWRNPLARTLWLAVKGRYLTNQYFRRHILLQAAGIRRRPPRVAEDLRVTPHPGLLAECPYWFRVQLYPYVVRCLLDRKQWPYLLPPAKYVAARPLGWIVRKPREVS
jgi:hypothetical protein